MSKRSNIDPYAVAGIAFGLEKLNDTNDILTLRGVLGAMGAFEDEQDMAKNDIDYLFDSEQEDDDDSIEEFDAEVRRAQRAAERADVEYRIAVENQQRIMRGNAFGCFEREWRLNELLYMLPPRENAEKVLSFLKTGYGKEPFAEELLAAYASWLETIKGIRLD